MVGMAIGVTCHFGLFLWSYTWHGKEYTDANVQTDAWDNYSDRPSQIISDITSIDTQTPKFSPVEYTSTGSQINSSTIETGSQTITDGASTTTTVLPIPPVDINVVPNQDLITKLPDWARFCPDHPNYLVWLAQNPELGITTSQFLNNYFNSFM